MTSTEDQVSQLTAIPLTREQVSSILEDWARDNAPSRFVLYGITDDPDYGGYDGDVLAWGLSFDDHVYVQSVDSQTGGRFSSIESMKRILFRRDRDIHLLWIDQPENPNSTNNQ